MKINLNNHILLNSNYIDLTISQLQQTIDTSRDKTIRLICQAKINLLKNLKKNSINPIPLAHKLLLTGFQEGSLGISKEINLHHILNSDIDV